MDQAELLNLTWAALLVVGCLIAWASNLVNVPGNWLIVIGTALYAHFGPSEGRLDVSWQVAVGVAVLAVIGELVEFIAGAVGTTRAGGSKRGAALALVGSMAGGIVGLFIGIPIPVIGSLISALLFAGLGAFAGAMLGERWKGRDMQESWRIGGAAFWSRMVGTLGKLSVGAAMLAVVIAALAIG